MEGTFDGVCNVFTEVAQSVLDTFLEVRPQGTDDDDDDDDGDGDENLSFEPSEAEIRAAIKQLKNGKAPVVHMITAELLKLGEETVVQWLAKLAASIWHSEAVPKN